MNPKVLVALGVALVATTAGIAMLHHRESEPTALIYLLDARRDPSKPLEQALPVVKQLERRYNAKVTVRSTVSLTQLGDYPSMFEEFDRTRDAIDPLPMFFRPIRPYTSEKKKLRAAIDSRVSLDGASRIRLLQRLVVVYDTERLSERDECTQLDADVDYGAQNFMGIGLLVQEGTLQELKKCMDILPPK